MTSRAFFADLQAEFLATPPPLPDVLEFRSMYWVRPEISIAVATVGGRRSRRLSLSVRAR